MKNYKEIIMDRLRNYWTRGDEIYVKGSFVEDGRTCELCGYTPIKNNFVLENSRTHEELIVGSKCVHNFKQAIKDLGEEVIIKSSNIDAIKIINRGHPGTVELIEHNRGLFEDDMEDTQTYSSEFEEIVMSSPDDLSPEGMGSEEFDWDSYDYEPPER